MQCTTYSQHKLKWKIKKTANRINSFGLILDWLQHRYCCGLKSFSTLARLCPRGMVESWYSSKVLGAGQHLHLFWTVSGLGNALKKSQRGNWRKTQNLCLQKAMENDSINWRLNLEKKLYRNKIYTVLCLYPLSLSLYY